MAAPAILIFSMFIPEFLCSDGRSVRLSGVVLGVQRGDQVNHAISRVPRDATVSFEHERVRAQSTKTDFSPALGVLVSSAMPSRRTARGTRKKRKNRRTRRRSPPRVRRAASELSPGDTRSWRAGVRRTRHPPRPELTGSTWPLRGPCSAESTRRSSVWCRDRSRPCSSPRPARTRRSSRAA
jgi:hypothetical protein